MTEQSGRVSETTERLAHAVDLLVLELREARHGEDVVDRVLRHRKSHVFVFVSPRRLPVIRDRIVDVRSDARLLEPRASELAVLANDDGEVGDKVVAVARDESAGVTRERLSVASGDRAATFVRFVETAQPDPEPSGLKFVEPGVARA